MRPAGLFCIADTLAGAAPFGEDLTVVVVGGGERQRPFLTVSNSLTHTGVGAGSSAHQLRAVLRTPEMAFSVRQWFLGVANDTMSQNL